MFHQVEDIKMFLSPIDLDRTGGDGVDDVVSTVLTKVLLKNARANAAIMMDEKGLATAFAERNGTCAMLETGLRGLKETLAPAVEGSSVDLQLAYDLGVAAFRHAQISDAVYAFTLLTGQTGFRAVALLGLAACACHQEDYKTAHVFAEASIACNEPHPRTHLIAGYSALRSGDKKTAKRQLALAARLARGDPQLRDEQRCAQRELLLMQLAS